MNKTTWHTVILGLTALLGLFYVLASLRYVFDGGDDFPSIQRILLGLLGTLLGLSMLVGALVSARRRWAGVALIALGAIPMAFILYWMLVITLPVTAAFVGYAVFWALRSGRAESSRESVGTLTGTS